MNTPAEGLPPRLPFTPMRGVLWMLGAALVMLGAVLIFLDFQPEAQTDHVSLGAISAASFLLVSALLLSRYPAGPSLAAGIGLRASSPLAILIGLAIGVVSQLPAESLARLSAAWLPSSEPVAGGGALFSSEPSHVTSAAMIIVLVFIVPLAEETFFRGAIYGALRRDGVSAILAATIAGVGFTMCHMSLRMLLPILLFAVVLSVLRIYSGSLWPCLSAHAAFNGVIVIGNAVGFELPRLSGLNELLSVLLLVFLLLGFSRLMAKSEAAMEARALDAIKPMEISSV